MAESSGKTEFIALTWAGVFSLFASGFLLSAGIETFRQGSSPVPEIFLSIMFALFWRADAKAIMVNGSYVRRFLMWSRSN